MKLLITICVCFILSFAHGQNRSVMVGPVISYDHYAIKLVNTYSSTVKYPITISCGLEYSYSANRILIGVKALTAKRVYALTRYTQPLNPSNPTVTSRIEVSARYFTLPITLSYQLIRTNRLRLYAGVGLVTEWVPGTFSGELFDSQGNSSLIDLPDTGVGHNNLVVGGNIQGVARYYLTDNLVVQLEPTFRFFPEIQTPYTLGNRKGFNTLLTVAFKLH